MGHSLRSEDDAGGTSTWGIWGGWTPAGRRSVLHRGDETYPLAEVGEQAWPEAAMRPGPRVPGVRSSPESMTPSDSHPELTSGRSE